MVPHPVFQAILSVNLGRSHASMGYNSATASHGGILFNISALCTIILIEVITHKNKTLPRSMISVEAKSVLKEKSPIKKFSADIF